MTRRCELTGKLPMAGQLRSHAENKTKRTFRPNLVNVTLLSEALDRSVKVRVSAHGLRSVEHNGGLDAYLLKVSAEQLSPQLQKLKRDLVKSKAAAAA
jgi:large subunit ribosomal protein L28